MLVQASGSSAASVEFRPDLVRIAMVPITIPLLTPHCNRLQRWLSDVSQSSRRLCQECKETVKENACVELIDCCFHPFACLMPLRAVVWDLRKQKPVIRY